MVMKLAKNWKYYLCVYGGRELHIFAYVHGGQRKTLGIICQEPSTFFFKKQGLSLSWIHQLD